ncbi:Fic family protein [Actinomycetota bacterium]
MSDLVSALTSLAQLPGLPDRIDAARDACTQLRWHQALRRRIPEAAAESRVRGAAASGELEGAKLSVDIVREVMVGLRAWPERLDPVEQVMRGVVQATAESEHVRATVTSAPLQSLARLHVAAAADLVTPEQLGRPRVDGEDVRELLEVGPAPTADEVRERLGGVVDILLAADRVPALVAAALVHAEIATMRPFVRGNGVVARAMERAVIQASGLDPTGVAVPEAGHGAGGGAAYIGALAAYAMGTEDGVRLWLEHCCEAVERGAAEGMRVADAVLAGRTGTA